MENSGSPAAAGVAAATAEMSVNAESNQQDFQDGSKDLEKKSEPVSKTYNIKVDGKVLQVGEDDLVKDYQLRAASHKRMQQAAEVEKRARQLEERYKKYEQDPKEFLEENYEKLREHAIRKLREELEYEDLSPEQKAYLQEKKQRETLENKLKQIEEEKKRMDYQKVEAHYAREIDREISSRVKLLQEFPQSKKYEMLKEIAALQASYLSNNGQLLDWDRLFNYAVSREKKHSLEYLKKVDLKTLPDEVKKHLIEQARQESLQRVQAFSPQTAKTDTSETKQVGKKLEVNSFFNKLENKFNKK